MEKYQLDELDKQILRMISENARIPFLEVARACNVSGAVNIYARNNSHLLSIIHNRLQPLGLSHTETIISFKETRQKQVPVPED